MTVEVTVYSSGAVPVTGVTIIDLEKTEGFVVESLNCPVTGS